MTDHSPKTGRVVGVGVGPGDPELLTLRAARALGDAALVVAPVSAAESDSIALSIVREHVPAGCEIAEMAFPMSRQAGERKAAASAAAARLAEAARLGSIAVFVTLGDATLYSTWGYVRDALAAEHPDVPVETVPGVTAASATAARLGVSLAEGAEPLLVWPTEPPSDLRALLAVAPRLAVLKGGRHLAALVESAREAGAEVAAVRRCGLPDERLAPDAAALLGERPDYLTTVLVRGRAGAGRARVQESVAAPGGEAGR